VGVDGEFRKRQTIKPYVAIVSMDERMPAYQAGIHIMRRLWFSSIRIRDLEYAKTLSEEALLHFCSIKDASKQPAMSLTH